MALSADDVLVATKNLSDDTVNAAAHAAANVTAAVNHDADHAHQNANTGKQH